jgi:hypothetical protein
MKERRDTKDAKEKKMREEGLPVCWPVMTNLSQPGEGNHKGLPLQTQWQEDRSARRTRHHEHQRCVGATPCARPRPPMVMLFAINTFFFSAFFLSFLTFAPFVSRPSLKDK